jgi:hypothetical protein
MRTDTPQSRAIAALARSVEGTLAMGTARVTAWFGRDPATMGTRPVGADQWCGVVDFESDRCRLEPKGVFDRSVAYTHLGDGEWMAQAEEGDRWPPFHPCWALEALTSAVLSATPRLGGWRQLDVQLCPDRLGALTPLARSWESVSATVTLDSQDRVRRVAIDLLEEPSAASEHLVFEFDQFGVGADIELPMSLTRGLIRSSAG